MRRREREKEGEGECSQFVCEVSGSPRSIIYIIMDENAACGSEFRRFFIYLFFLHRNISFFFSILVLHINWVGSIASSCSWHIFRFHNNFDCCISTMRGHWVSLSGIFSCLKYQLDYFHSCFILIMKLIDANRFSNYWRSECSFHIRLKKRMNG